MLGKISVAISGTKSVKVRLKRVGHLQIELLRALDTTTPKSESTLAREMKIERKQVTRMLQGLVGRGYVSFNHGSYLLTTMGHAFRRSQEVEP